MPALLDLLKDQIGENTIRQLSSQIDADAASTRRGVAAALPLVIGALSRNANRSADHARSLDRALEEDHDGSLLHNLSAVLDRSGGGGSFTDAASGALQGVSIDRRAADGDGILGHLLGAKRTAVELGISKASDLDVKKVRMLLSLLAPIVMSALGQVKRDRSLDAQGVQHLLEEEKSHIEHETQAGNGRGLLSFFDREEEGQIADEVARVGSALTGTALMDRLFSGSGNRRR